MSRDPWLPTFIGGFRSGSTLLINLLGMHEEVAPWFETKAFCEPLRWLREIQRPEQAAFERSLSAAPDPALDAPFSVAARMKEDIQLTAHRLHGEAASGKAPYEWYPLGFDCVLYSSSFGKTAIDEWTRATTPPANTVAIARATGELITKLGNRHAELAGRPYWVNKTPEIPRFGFELRQSLGPCRIILLVRNGRDVAASAYALQWASIPQLAAWWKHLIELSRAAADASPGLYMEVRYEDLVRSPAETLDQIFDFLGLAKNGPLISAKFQQFSGTRKQAHRLGSGGARPTLSLEQARAFDEVAGPLMRQLGYSS